MDQSSGIYHEANDDLKETRSKCEDLQTCPYCQKIVELIWVHSHYQCPKCKYVVVSCCGDS